MTVYRPNTHGLLDLYDCDAEILRDVVQLEQLFQAATNLIQANVLSSYFHKFGGHGGVTGVLLLSESHISIHTWPEHRFAAVDIFLCGKGRAQTAADFFQVALKSERSVWHEYPRGTLLSWY